MDYSKYRDIAPYRGRDFDAAIRRLMEKREYLGAFVSVLVGGNDFSTIYNYLGTVVENISKVHDYPEFQKRITAGLLVPTVVERTMAVCGNLVADHLFFDDVVPGTCHQPEPVAGEGAF